MDNQGQQELIVLDTFEPAVAFDPAKRDESRRRFSMFLVQSEAGQGGTGVVQRATNTAGEIFAIKRLHVSDTTDERIAAGMRAVLFEEYRNQLTVSHLKGFPRVYGYGTSNGEPLIVMEWVEGSTLKHITPQLPHEDGGVRGDAVAAIGVAVLSILNNVRHLDTGVAHRDISPRNIMVATSERSLQDQIATLDFDIRLIDFGSSTALNPIDPTFTVRADVWRGGTPEYAPPEMLTHDIAGIETRRLSPTVDIYALSSVLYELYCGHTPFNLQALGTASPYRVKTETAFEIPQARTAADEALVSIIVAGLAVDQERRPSVEQMLDLLRRWQSSELGDWPTPEPVWGSRVMDAQTTYIGPGTSVDEPVPATFDTAQPVMFPLDDNDVSAPVDPFAAAPDAATEDAPLDHGHRDRASYLPVPVVLEAPRAAYGADAAVSAATSMPAAPATSATPSMHAPATPAAGTAVPVAQNAILAAQRQALLHPPAPPVPSPLPAFPRQRPQPPRRPRRQRPSRAALFLQRGASPLRHLSVAAPTCCRGTYTTAMTPRLRQTPKATTARPKAKKTATPTLQTAPTPPQRRPTPSAWRCAMPPKAKASGA